MKLLHALREPLVHFLALGLGLFVLHAIVAPGDAGGDKIVITKARIISLAQQYQQTWNRPPNATELRALIDSEVRNQVMVREGKALGLDRDDAVIERRIRQKYELISEDEDADRLPGEADLSAYLKAHPEKFRQPATVSFDQILFEVEGDDVLIDSRIRAARAALAQGRRSDDLGDATMLPHHVNAMGLDLVSRDFGEKFSTAVGRMPVGIWGQPIVSGFGVHLVRVRDRSVATVPALADIRNAVAREWENDRRVAKREASYQQTRKKYAIVIEGEPPQ